jgi:hypothetical protein
MPTHDEDKRFRREFRRLTRDQRRAFFATLVPFIEDLRSPGRNFRPGLRVKGVAGHPGIFEMTWAPDGRATFSFGEPITPGEPHIIWRRCGSHDIFRDP